MHELGGYSTPLSTIISLYRFRLRQFNNLFLVDDRDCLSSLFHHPENISDLLNDEYFALCEQHDIINNELRDIFEGLIEPFTCQIENLVTDENLVDKIFPVVIHFLADDVQTDPQIFLKPAITIAQYISSSDAVDTNTELSAFAASSTTFIDFFNFVVAKLRQVFLTIDFYSLDLWSIHKLQAFIHKQKTESWLLNSLVQQFGNPKDTLILMGDYGKKGSKNLKHQRATRGIGWIQFLKRNGFEVSMINEAFTSAKCPVCFEKVATFLRVTNPRFYRREKTPVPTCHSLSAFNSESCKLSNKGSTKLFNRNKLACLNMFAIAEARLSGNERPPYLCSR
ncbi:hypothetical protein P9112_008246 [Eukaryota sp. TZLM1-RC]